MSAKYGAILAGGQGTRMGGDKSFALLGGKPLVAWVIEALTPQVDHLIVLGEDGRLGSFGLPMVPDVPGVQGPAGGLLAAIGYARAASAAALLIAPCDMPFLPKDLMRRLSRGAQIGVPRISGRLNWAVSCWPAARFPDMEGFGRDAAIYKRAPSLRGVIEASDYVDLPQDDSAKFVGINTPDALAAAQATLLQQGEG